MHAFLAESLAHILNHMLMLTNHVTLEVFANMPHNQTLRLACTGKMASLCPLQDQPRNPANAAGTTECTHPLRVVMYRQRCCGPLSEHSCDVCATVEQPHQQHLTKGRVIPLSTLTGEKVGGALVHTCQRYETDTPEVLHA